MSANEQLDSYFGAVGEDGTSFARRFLVIKPSNAGSDWDPRFDTELRQKAGLGTEWRKLKGASCKRYVLVDNPGGGTNKFLVDAIYEPPTALDPGFGGAWHVDISGSLDVAYTDTVRPTAREQALLGDPDYELPRIVGPLMFLKTDDRLQSPWPLPAGAEEYTLGPSDGEDVVELYTKKSQAKAQRVLEGMEWWPPVMTFACTKKFTNAEAARTMKIASHHGNVNRKEINLLGRAWFMPGQLMLADYRITEVPGPSATDPIAHDVTIVFAARSDTWQYEFMHLYSDDNETGKAAQVVWYKSGHPFLDGGDPMPVVETLRRQPWTDFNGFLEAL